MKLYDCNYYLHTPVQIWVRTADKRPVIIYFDKGEMGIDIGLPNEDHDTFEDLFEIFDSPVESDYHDNRFISLERVQAICNSIDEKALISDLEKQMDQHYESWINSFTNVKQYDTAFGPLYTLTINNEYP